MLSKIKCIALSGMQPIEVDVEVSVTRGIPTFEIVGLPNKSIEESKHRIKSAFLNTGLEFADSRITVNLAPAEISKSGSSYDLAIAVGVYCAKNGISIPPDTFFFGELSLDGTIRSSRGAYLALDHIDTINGFVFVSEIFASYIHDFKNLRAYAVRNLIDVFDHISKRKTLSLVKVKKSIETNNDTVSSGILVTDIIGQEIAKRALEISAAGGHNLMMVGSPGTGKTMLANSIISILPPLSRDEVSEIKKIRSYVGLDLNGIIRPFRNPHHTISYSGMLGGGTEPLPGEVTLAHKGVLFMDEFAEFSRNVLEALRQPLQDKISIINRHNKSYVFPCDFSLVAASNPCPCGYLGHKIKPCICTEQRIIQYAKKLSGPIVDRFDLYTTVYPEESFRMNLVATHTSAATTASIALKVTRARNIQMLRLKKYNLDKNANMTNREISLECPLNEESMRLLDLAYKKFNLTPRSYFKVIKVARTIADLDDSPMIKTNHVAEALQYRQRSTS